MTLKLRSNSKSLLSCFSASSVLSVRLGIPKESIKSKIEIVGDEEACVFPILNLVDKATGLAMAEAEEIK